MAEKNPIIQQLNSHLNRINRMLALRRISEVRSGSADRSGFVQRLSVGDKFTQASRQMRVLKPTGMGNLKADQLHQVGKEIREKFASPQKLLHIAPQHLGISSFWTQMDTVLAGQAVSEPIPTQQGIMSPGTVIQKYDMFPEPGQSIDDFKEQASRIPARPEPKPAARRPTPDPKSRMFSKVEEITPHTQPVVEPEELPEVSELDPEKLDWTEPETKGLTLDQPARPAAPRPKPVSTEYVEPETKVSAEPRREASQPEPKTSEETKKPDQPVDAAGTPTIKSKPGPTPTVQRKVEKKPTAPMLMARLVKKEAKRAEPPIAQIAKTKRLEVVEPSISPAPKKTDPIPDKVLEPEWLDMADLHPEPREAVEGPLQQLVQKREHAPKAMPVIRLEKPKSTIKLKRSTLTTSHPKAAGLQIDASPQTPRQTVQRKVEADLPQTPDARGLQVPIPPKPPDKEEKPSVSPPQQDSVPEKFALAPLVMAQLPRVQTRSAPPVNAMPPRQAEQIPQPVVDATTPAQTEKPTPGTVSQPVVQRLVGLSLDDVDRAGQGLLSMGQSDAQDPESDLGSFGLTDEMDEGTEFDLEALAEELLPLVKRMIEIETERTSGFL